MAVSGYLAKLKGGLGLAFATHFLHENKWPSNRVKNKSTSFEIY